MRIQPSISRKNSHLCTILLLGILILSSALLFYSLGSKSLWIDEYNNVDIAARSSLHAVMQGLLETGQRQPPMYFWMLHVWIRLAGTGDGAVRGLSVLMGLASIALIFKIGCQLEDVRTGLIAAYLLAISPTFVLYARMARYYMPTLLFGLISCCLFLKLLRSSRSSNNIMLWCAYTLTNLFLVLSSYVSVAVLIFQIAFFHPRMVSLCT
jgi:uncharacterized membrane protein